MNLAGQVGKQVYKLGSSGSVVRAMQLRLVELGYPLKGTGYFGSATDTAVSAFQRSAGLKADGRVGAQTATALDAVGTAQPPLAGVERPLWLTGGLALVGTKEFSGSRDNQVIIDWAKDEGGAIARDYSHDSIPWCALFANHLLTKVGLKGTETLWALDFAGKWPSVQLSGPTVGAFAPMLRDGGGHIIVVAGRDQHDNIMGLGGNQHDAVSVAPFARSRLNKGFWWPEDVPLPVKIGFETLPIVTSDGRVSTKED